MVSRVSRNSLAIDLDVDLDVQPAAAEASEAAAGEKAALEAASAEARRMLGKLVRVEWVGSDVTHRRNLGAGWG